jgi:hypothetical protein
MEEFFEDVVNDYFKLERLSYYSILLQRRYARNAVFSDYSLLNGKAVSAILEKNPGEDWQKQYSNS